MWLLAILKSQSTMDATKWLMAVLSLTDIVKFH